MSGEGDGRCETDEFRKFEFELRLVIGESMLVIGHPKKSRAKRVARYELLHFFPHGIVLNMVEVLGISGIRVNLINLQVFDFTQMRRATSDHTKKHSPTLGSGSVCNVHQQRIHFHEFSFGLACLIFRACHRRRKIYFNCNATKLYDFQSEKCMQYAVWCGVEADFPYTGKIRADAVP